jgi:hypothetical protein
MPNLPLAPLHARLQAWRRVRRVRRVAAAGSAWLLVAIWSLAGLICLDAWLYLSHAARLALGLVLLCALGGLAALTIVKVIRCREDSLWLALRWEATLRSEGDLVAALQFEKRVVDGTALPLERAVVEYVAACAPHLPPPPQEQGLPLPVGCLALTVLLAAAWFAAAPGAVATRLQRWALADVPASTRTRLVSLSVATPHQRRLDPAANTGTSTQLYLVQAWQPLRLRAAVAGHRPPTGEVLVLSAGSVPAVRLPLLPESASHAGSTWYAARLPPLGQPVTCEVHVGDAPPRRVRLRPLSPPTLALRWQVFPPPGSSRTFHQISSPELVVPPHARLRLSVRSPQKLQRAELRIANQRHALQHTQDGRWVLSVPLDVSASPGRHAYSLHVQDAHGLVWHQLVEGGIRVREPQPLRVSLETSATEVYFQSQAELRYAASAASGVAQLALHLHLWREDALAGRQQRILGVGPGRPTMVAGAIWLDLTELRALPGDEVELLLEAAGPDGQAVFSESQRLAVVDTLALLEQLHRPEAWLGEIGGAPRPSPGEPAAGAAP